jgi:chemotaxis protein methyltransferase CheR
MRTAAAVNGERVEDLEVQLLVEGVFRHYGFDFRDYAPGSLKRRIRHSVTELGAQTISGLQAKVLHDPQAMKRLLLALSVNVTSMFRDPPFYLALRRKVVPLLRHGSLVRVWVAGCSSGEEAYSAAIVLEEEGLYDKCRIYATDMNEAVLERARAGILTASALEELSRNYRAAGGTRPIGSYLKVEGEQATVDPALKRNLLFASHNLATDSSFNEFHLILCRNVLIYFNRTLQARVHEMVYGSLALDGVLGLGARESLRFSPHENCYEALGAERLYRRVR